MQSNEKYIIENINKYCYDFLKKQSSIERDVELINFLEYNLNTLKKIISKKIDSNAKILKIEEIEYKKIIKCIDEESRDIPFNYFINGQQIKPYAMKNNRKNHIFCKENLEYDDNEEIEQWITQEFKKSGSKQIHNNLILEEVDLGFDNKYTTYCINSIDNTNIDKIPFDTLIFDKSIEQIVIKLGDIDNYKIVNTKLCKVYSYRNNTDNFRSIICNNIKNNKSKTFNQEYLCNLKNCKYYHDPFIGCKNNYHKNRQYSSNPVVFSNGVPMHNFKSGEHVKENIENIKWIDAITLYQASLANLLIACVHSKK